MKMERLLIVCFFLVLAGCANAEKDDLSNYIKELRKVVKAESLAMNAYASVSGSNYTDDETVYEALTETIIPASRDYLNKLEAITVRLQTKEIRALNEKAIEAVTLQNNAFVLLMDILEEQDRSRVVDFNERLDKARRLGREWQTEVQDLCKKNGI
ncbi:MAG: hypothetical protein LBC99_01935 [Spirochaetota bacterium]|jgi:hypothetical protein|nr:hypothetical protein [Spirochaetota bacterium]